MHRAEQKYRKCAVWPSASTQKTREKPVALRTGKENKRPSVSLKISLGTICDHVDRHLYSFEDNLLSSTSRT